MKVLIIFLIVSFAAGCSSNNKKNKNIEELDSAANLLMHISDDTKELKNNCSLSPQEALNILRPLQAMLDDAKSTYPDKILESDLIDCNRSCHCGLFLDIAISQKSNFSIPDKYFKDKKSLLKCANSTAKWFCTSPLLQKLKKESEIFEYGQ